jgi:adenylate kinase
VSNTSRELRYIVLGAPGAGKGTQAENISAKYNIPHISTGDIFRETINLETALGKEVKGYLDAGQLAPDELTVRVVEDRLKKPDCVNGFVLDGFPRTIFQAESLDKMSELVGKRVAAAINIMLDDSTIIERLSNRRVCKGCGKSWHMMYAPPAVDGVCDACGGELFQRDDDTPDVIKSRLATYHARTEPLIGYYRQKGILLEIKGKEEIADTTKVLFEALERII